MLGFYFFFLMIIVAAEVGAVTIYALKKNQVEAEITDLFTKAVRDFDQQVKNSPGTKELIVQKVQQTLECCGAESYSSYTSNIYPASCCRQQLGGDCSAPDVYKQGCVPALKKWFGTHIFIMMGIITGIVILQIVCMILSIVLCCHIRREKAFYV